MGPFPVPQNHPEPFAGMIAQMRAGVNPVLYSVALFLAPD